MQRLLHDAYALVPPEQSYSRSGEQVCDKEISAVLLQEAASPFRLADGAVNFIVDLLNSEKPRSVIEFGSGMSTLWLSMLLTRIHGSVGFRFLSIEQEELELRHTVERLKSLGPSLPCRVVHCPLVPGIAGGRETAFYDLRTVPEAYFRWLGKAELIIIDGPFAQGPCRYGAVREIKEYVKPGARFLMDDSLREKELFTGYLWTQDGFKVDGVYTVGEGVMVGRFPR